MAGMYEPMEVPLMQEMVTDMETVPGVVVRQVTQVMDAAAQMAGLPYEKENRYKISALPDGRRAARGHGEPGSWSPSAQELDQ